MALFENEIAKTLSRLLPSDEGTTKTASEKTDAKEEKIESKGSGVVSLIKDLVKLAGELDDAGAEDASNLVDEALRVIVNNIKSTAQAPEESFEDDKEAEEAGKVLEEFLKEEDSE